MMKQRHRQFSREFKLSVVQSIARGEKSPTQVRQEHQLHRSVLYEWLDKYDRLGEQAFASRKNKWMRNLEAATLPATMQGKQQHLGSKARAHLAVTSDATQNGHRQMCSSWLVATLICLSV